MLAAIMRRRAKAVLGLWAAGVLAGVVGTGFGERSAVAQNAADKAAAEALFDEGKRLFLEKKYAEACPRFEGSQRIDPGIGTLLFLADCYEKEGRVASAWATFREASYAAKAGGQLDREKVASDRAHLLEPHLYRLTINVEAPAPGLKVTRNDTEVKSETWSAALPVDPGPYTMSATAPGKKPWSMKIEIPSSAGTQAITVPPLDDDPNARKLAEAQPGGAPLAPVVVPGRSQRVAGVLIGSVGVVGLAVAGVLGGIASSKSSTAKALCPVVPCSNKTAIDGENAAGSLADGSTAMFAIGGGALAAGLITLFTAPSAKSAKPPSGRWIVPTFGPGVAGLSAGTVFQ
jgi:hypothetical protein